MMGEEGEGGDNAHNVVKCPEGSRYGAQSADVTGLTFSASGQCEVSL